MKVIPCAQGSMAWIQAHCGVVSGSYMAHVLDFTKNGTPGSKRKTYLRRKLGELLTAKALQQNYVSWEMEQGSEREPLARASYEREEQVMVQEIGFALHDSIPRWGGSVDGLVGDDGFVEIKSPTEGTHAECILDGVIPEDYITQMDSYFSVTGRLWGDFVSFCPDVPKPLRTMIIRRERDEKAIALIEEQVQKFNAEVDARIEKLRSIVGPFELPAAVQEVEPSAKDFGDLGLSDADGAAFISGKVAI